jgi:uncharacterized phiE125 gp8 family phage protein
MRDVVYTAATADPFTLDELKEDRRIDGGADDKALAMYAKRAVDFLEAQLNRNFISTVRKLYLDEFPDVIEIERLPVSTITSVVYYNTAGTLTTLSATSYQTDIVSPDSPARIAPAPGTSWPSTEADRLNAVIVTYTAGYGAAASAVPQRVRHAIGLLVAHMHENREPLAVGIAPEQLPYSLQYALSLIDSRRYG